MGFHASDEDGPAWSDKNMLLAKNTLILVRHSIESLVQLI
jgi:hypothetical protein